MDNQDQLRKAMAQAVADHYINKMKKRFPRAYVPVLVGIVLGAFLLRALKYIVFYGALAFLAYKLNGLDGVMYLAIVLLGFAGTNYLMLKE